MRQVICDWSAGDNLSEKDANVKDGGESHCAVCDRFLPGLDENTVRKL